MFRSGTLIRTTRGEVAVESLEVGDLAVVATGELRVIRWIGHVVVDAEQSEEQTAPLPVRIAPGAFGARKPSVDLYLSSCHCVCVCAVTDVLIPILELVNGSTIALEATDATPYWHLELDSHDVLLANGLPTESFIEPASLDGGPSGPRPDLCRPFAEGGEVVAFAREQLTREAARLGWRASREVSIVCVTERSTFAPVRRDGEAIFALPSDAADVRIETSMTTPALIGGADARRVGLAIYSAKLMGADGETRLLDLDHPALAVCFHDGEKQDGRHFRWMKDALVVPLSFRAGLLEPAMLLITYEPTTVRGWTDPRGATRRPAPAPIGGSPPRYRAQEDVAREAEPTMEIGRRRTEAR